MAATYNPQLVVATWAGILFQGEMDGEMYSLEFQEDRNTLHVGAKGHATLTRNANESAILTVMLSQTSPTNRQLSAAYAANLKGPFLMRDASEDGLTVVESEDVVIQKFTEIKRGKEHVATTWKFILPKCIATVGGVL
jgi:hypothetical protein